MSIQHFKPEIWAAELLIQLRKTLVFAGPGVVNHDYEGDIQQGGDTVHISSVGDVTIGDYSGSNITYDEIDDSGQVLVVDQKKYFAKKFDDVDKAQSENGGAVMAQMMSQAAYRLSDTADQYVAGLYTQASTANVINGADYDLTTAGQLAYDVLVDLGVVLDEANVPSEGRYVVVPPWFHGLIRKDINFINANKSADGGEALRNGVVGMAAGFDILKSNNCVVPSAGENVIMAGTPMAVSFANQIVKTEALRDLNTFSDLVRGLHVYGAKVTYSDGLAYTVLTRPGS